jgi:hypothetical protein
LPDAHHLKYIGNLCVLKSFRSSEAKMGKRPKLFGGTGYSLSVILWR